MGMRRELEIAERQALIGLKPATRRQAELLEKMSNAAFELIKVIELERSGIRDGDGYWSGDPMGRTARQLVTIINLYEQCRDEDWEAQQKKDGHRLPSADDFPWY
jgi:hypothetical protein